MPGGGIVGYEPVEGQPDALNFKTSDGRSLIAFGPEAMQLKQRIDSTPQPLFAGPGAAGYGPPSPPPQGQLAAPEFAAAPQAPAAPPSTSAPPGPVSPQAAGPAGAPNPTGDLGAYLTAPVRVGGSAGVSRQQLLDKSTQGVAMGKSATQGVEGGFAPSADYLNNLGESSMNERLVRDDVAERDALQAQAEADMYREQFAKNAAKEASAAKHAQLMNEGVTKQQALLSQARMEFSSAKVDPKRIFSGDGGAMRAIGSIVASALGAYAATAGKTPSFAQNIIDNAIDRDIRAQEATIQIKGESAGNALQDLMRQTGDLETAKSALRVIQMDQAQRQIAAFAADSKSQKIKDAATLWDIEHQKSLNDKVEEYRQRSIGKVTQQVQQEMLYPKAGSAGYVRDATDAEVARRAGIAKTVQDIGASRAGIAKTEADTDLSRANAEKARTEGKAGPEDKEYQKSIANITNHKAQVAALASKYGYTIKDGQIVPGEKAGFPTRYNVSEYSGLDTGLTSLGVTFSAIANSDAELGEAAKAKLTPSPSELDSTIVQKLQAQLDYVNTKEGALKGVANPGTVQAIEGRQQNRGASIRAQAEGGQGGASAPAFTEE